VPGLGVDCDLKERESFDGGDAGMVGLKVEKDEISGAAS
jgi:hypothetical protein